MARVIDISMGHCLSVEMEAARIDKSFPIS